MSASMEGVVLIIAFGRLTGTPTAPMVGTGRARWEFSQNGMVLQEIQKVQTIA